jgi:hypothetical protein
MKKLLTIFAFLPMLAWASNPRQVISPQMWQAINDLNKPMFARTAASYSPGEYMGVGVTSDGLGFVVTDAAGLFCNSAITTGTGTPNLIGTSTQMVMAINNLHNANWLDVNGHVWGGGEQCGNPYITGTNVYEENLDSSGNDRKFSMVANFWNNPDGEEGYTVGIEQNGTVWITGDTRNGARGNGTAGADLQPWVQVPIAANIIPRKIYGAFATFLLCDTVNSGGTVIGQRLYSWSNNGGRAATLGYATSAGFGSGASSVGTYNVPTEIKFNSQHAHNILCVSGGLDCNYALFDSAISGRPDSTLLYCWGSYGWRMAHSTSVGEDFLNVPTNITSNILTSAVKTAARSTQIDTVCTDNGSTHILVGSGSTRVLVGWGSTEQGTLGNGLQLNFATFSTPYNEGGQDEFEGQLVQFTPVIISPGKTNWKTLCSNGFYGYYNQFQDDNGNWFFCGRYKAFIAPLGMHSADFASGNLASVMNCGWQYPILTKQWDAFAVTCAPTTGQGCAGACVGGPVSNAECSAITVTCFAIHAGLSVTSSGTTAFLNATGSTYAGTRLQHVKFYIDGNLAPGIADNFVDQIDSANGLSVGSHTAKVVIQGQYWEADSTTASFTISSTTITHFYCDSSAGSDANSGALGLPVKTLAGVNALAIIAGDTISFNRGYHYPGTLNLSVNHVLVNAYGSGVAPIIAGLSTLTFSGTAPNLTATCSGCTAATSLFVFDGVPAPIARTPNASTGYYPFTPASSSTTTVFGSNISSLPNIVGDSIVVRSSPFTIDKSKITAKSGSTITFSPAVSFVNVGGSGWFYYDGTPDTASEWVYSGGVGGTFTANGISGHIGQAAGTDIGINITGSFCKVTGIRVEGVNKNLIQVVGQADSLVNDSLQYAGQDGVNANGQGLYVNGCYVNHVQNSGINQAFVGATTASWNITYNTIDHFGLIPGQGQNASGTTEGIAAPGAGTVIRHNVVSNGGFNAIYSGNGDSTYVDSNYVFNFNLNKIDGGGIYWWTSSAVTISVGRFCRGNIALNGGGPNSYAGTSVTNGSAVFGYYSDNQSNGITFNGNVSWHMLSGGWLNHGPNNTFTNNLLGDDGNSGAWNAEVSGGPTITGVVFSNNTVYGDSTADALYRLSTVNADLTTMQTATNNIYVHSLQTTVFWTKSNTDVGTNRTLSGWQSNTGGDAGSTFQNLTLTLAANSSFTTQTFNLGGTYRDLNGNFYYPTITLPQLSGILLELKSRGVRLRIKGFNP